MCPRHLKGYGRKGLLQRTYDSIGSLIPAMGTCTRFTPWPWISSTAYPSYSFPALWLNRGDVSMSGVINTK